VRWDVWLPGQPVSWDSAYPMGKMPVRRKSGPVLNADGSQKMIHRPVKSDAAKVYQEGVQTIVQAAKPSRWLPTEQVRVFVDLYLMEDIDCDNATKLVFDAAAKAIGCNDRLFLPCYRIKIAGYPDRGQVGIRLTFDDDAGTHG
jgi:hypothetical protein